MKMIDTIDKREIFNPDVHAVGLFKYFESVSEILNPLLKDLSTTYYLHRSQSKTPCGYDFYSDSKNFINYEFGVVEQDGSIDKTLAGSYVLKFPLKLLKSIDTRVFTCSIFIVDRKGRFPALLVVNFNDKGFYTREYFKIRYNEEIVQHTIVFIDDLDIIIDSGYLFDELTDQKPKIEFYDNEVFNYSIGRTIYYKFASKWDKDIVDILESSFGANDYNIVELKNSLETRNLTKNGTDTLAFIDRETTKLKSFGNRNDTSEKSFANRTTESETSFEGRKDTEGYYGFNSVNSVPVSDVTPTGKEKDKTTQNGTEIDILTKTGTETDKITEGGSQTNTTFSSDGGTISVEDNNSITGYKNNPVENLIKNLSMREKYTIYDVIFKDVDSVATLKIYI